MFEDIGFTLLVLTVSGAIMVVVSRSFDRDEAPLLIVGFFAHVVGVFLQLWITFAVYGGGDIDGYYRSGTELAHALATDFTDFMPEAIKLFFHQEDAYFPFAVFGGPSATGSLTVIASLLFYVLDDSLYAVTMVAALGALFGKIAIYGALRPGLPAEARKAVLVGVLLVPSVVYWSCNFAKESVVIAFLGLMSLAVGTLVRGEVKFGQLAIGVIAMIPVAMIKPYVLLTFAVAVGVWFYVERSRRTRDSVVIKPVYFVLAAGVAIAGVVLVGRLSPQFAVENLARSTASAQVAGARVEGGSNYQLGGDPTGEVQYEPTEEQASLARQLLLAPLALPTALFRPSLVEVRNPMMALNALETTALLFLVVRLFWRGGLRWMRETVFANPTLVFCFVYTVLLGTAVGLASTNMGSLSRYRIPFMPFFVTLVLVLDRLLAPRGAAIPGEPLALPQPVDQA